MEIFLYRLGIHVCQFYLLIVLIFLHANLSSLILSLIFLISFITCYKTNFLSKIFRNVYGLSDGRVVIFTGNDKGLLKGFLFYLEVSW